MNTECKVVDFNGTLWSYFGKTVRPYIQRVRDITFGFGYDPCESSHHLEPSIRIFKGNCWRCFISGINSEYEGKFYFDAVLTKI